MISGELAARRNRARHPVVVHEVEACGIYLRTFSEGKSKSGIPTVVSPQINVYRDR